MVCRRKIVMRVYRNLCRGTIGQGGAIAPSWNRSNPNLHHRQSFVPAASLKTACDPFFWIQVPQALIAASFDGMAEWLTETTEQHGASSLNLYRGTSRPK